MVKTKERPILKDPDIFPSPDVLKDALGKSYAAYEKLMAAITTEEVALDPQWNYYKDGNAWLCKILHKKKTIIWFSVWAEHFRIVFYFNKKPPRVFSTWIFFRISKTAFPKLEKARNLNRWLWK